MREALIDIREKLQEGIYLNEEHVRLSLVCRLLSKLDWEIWDPAEVNTEFPAIPTEDKTKVDIALFADKIYPSIFIEVKAVGKISANLSEVERQVRDYNRNNTALFSVITDGKSWRFYYSQTRGEFHQKCFKECDLIEDDLDKLEQTFALFLGKENILNGRAEDQASKYLQLTNQQKAVQECLPQARQLVQSHPYPSLPQAIVDLMKQKGVPISEKEVTELMDRMSDSRPAAIAPSRSGAAPVQPSFPKSQGVSNTALPLLNPNNPGDLRFTRVEGNIGGKHSRKWNELVNCGIRLALENGVDVRSLNAYLPANIREGTYTGEGYSPIGNLNVSVQGMQANTAEKTLVLLAKRLNCSLELTVSWYGKSPRAGEQAFIRWPA